MRFESLGGDKSICNNDGIYAMDFAINAGKYRNLLCGIEASFPRMQINTDHCLD